MAFFTYVSPILPSKTNSLLSYFLEKEKMKQEDPAQEEVSKDFYNLIGLKSWRGWISSINNQDYLIHCLEGDDLTNILLRFQYFIILGMPIAKEIYNIFRSHLNRDLVLKNHLPIIEHKLTLTSEVSLLNEKNVKSIAIPIKGSKLALFDESIKQRKECIQFSEHLSKIEISQYIHLNKDLFIILQASGDDNLSWEDLDLGLSSSEYKSIFGFNRLPFPMTFDEFSGKILAPI